MRLYNVTTNTDLDFGLRCESKDTESYADSHRDLDQLKNSIDGRF